MDIKDVNVRRPQLFQACFHADIHILHVVARIVHLDVDILYVRLVTHGVLDICGQHVTICGECLLDQTLVAITI